MLKKRKICLATVTTDSFIVGTLVTIYSFLKHNSWFDGDIVVICNELAGKNKKYLENLDERVKFLSVSQNLIENVTKVVQIRPEFSAKQARFYSLETFRLKDYDQVLFCDSDLLFRGSIKEVFELQQEFIACGDGAFYKGKTRHWEKDRQLANTFNSGFFLVKNSLLTDSNYEKLLEIINPNIYQSPKIRQTDQVVLNLFFAGKQHLIGGIYNYLAVHWETILRNEKISLSDAKVIHFNGPQKPWMAEGVLDAIMKKTVLIKASLWWWDSYTECLEELYLKNQMQN
jgi:lipopolysaccharide biosynthesis glycosyltransferase